MQSYPSGIAQYRCTNMFSERKTARTKNTMVRLSPEEYSVLQKAAELEGMTPSAYIRQAIYKQVQQSLPDLVAQQ